jgi:hypothetical protein
LENLAESRFRGGVVARPQRLFGTLEKLLGTVIGAAAVGGGRSK